VAARGRKKTTRRKGASRGKKQGGSHFPWFLAGLLIGLGISAFAFYKGYLPEKSDPDPVANPASSIEPELIDNQAGIADSSNDRRYDFFTVLPEMEVIVPEQELSREALPPVTLADEDVSATYILQVGSFRNSSDAEQMKARLALLGNVASIQVVTVNDATWHRVRIGPVEGARRADEIRRVLQDNGIETLVMKGSS